MDPPGQAMPDCLIAARIANAMERVLREQGKAKQADKFKGFDWKTEEDAFMDGYHNHAGGGKFVTYERLRAMGTNGFQEPAVDFKDGKLVGTKRLFTDGKFGAKDGKATFMATKWRGLQAPGKEAERKKWPFLINNGRSNVVWQNAYLDQDNSRPAIWSRFTTTTARRRRSSIRPRRQSGNRPSCCSPIRTACRATWSRPG
jgi:arsenite oxidase large subunit